MLRSLTAIFLLAFPTAGAAQEVTFSPDQINQCMANGGWRECIGVSAQACMDNSPGGYSTVGMNDCLERERAWWDGQLNKAYAALIASEKVFDAEPVDPDQPSGEAAVRDMQRAWITFRDATCNYETLKWYGGTGANGAWLGCQMRMTGEQALYLQSSLAAG